MRKAVTWLVMGSLLGGAVLETLPAEAAVARPDGVAAHAVAAHAEAGAPVEAVQFRHRGGRPYVYRHGYRGDRGYRDYGYHRRRGRVGAAIAGGVVGLAAGAIVGNALAQQRASGDAAVRSCAARFRSYDPASGTYLGYDGARHPCP